MLQAQERKSPRRRSKVDVSPGWIALLTVGLLTVGLLMVAMIAIGACSSASPRASTDEDRTPSSPVVVVASSTSLHTSSVPGRASSGGAGQEQLGVLGSRLKPVEGQSPVERSSICGALGPDRCAALGDSPDDLHWSVAVAENGGRILSVYAPVAGEISARDGQVVEVFRAVEEGAEWVNLIIADTDVSGDGRSDLIVGFRSGGSAALLQVDLVESASWTVATRIYDKGRLRVDVDGIRVWGARFAPDDANCCPSSYVEEVLGWSDGRWVVVDATEVTQDAVSGVGGRQDS